MINLELLAWQIGYFMLYTAVMLLAIIIHNDNKVRKALHTTGKYIGRKGTYTFTPHEVNR